MTSGKLRLIRLVLPATLSLLGWAQGRAQSAESLAQQGVMEARQEHFDAAIDAYAKALALRPDMPGLRMNLGLAYFKSARFKEALRTFTEEARQHPSDARLTVLIGMAHYGMGDYLVAVPYLQRAADSDPQNVPLRLTLAHSCLWSKQYDCVLDTCKQMLALNADSAEADMIVGEALDQTGNSAGAMEQFRAAIQSNPREPNAHFALGYLLWQQSKYAEAADEFQAELANDPTHVRARTYLGDCYTREHKDASATAELDKAVTADPGSPMAHLDLGIVAMDRGETATALAELERAAKLDPADPQPHWRLAKLYQSAGRTAEAKAEAAIVSGMSAKANEAVMDRIGAAHGTGESKP